MKIKNINTMKKYLFIFALLLGTVSSWGQNAADQENVLAKCLGVPQVTAHYDADVAGIPSSLYALKAPGIILPGVTVKYSGTVLAFISEEVLSQVRPDGYFTFTQLNITGSTADVKFTYSYNCNTVKQVIGLRVALKKTDGTWTITGINQ